MHRRRLSRPLQRLVVAEKILESTLTAARRRREEHAIRRLLFNVDFHGTWHRFGPAVQDTFDLPTITVFVVLEQDDGFRFDPAYDDLDDVILEGTSTLP